VLRVLRGRQYLEPLLRQLHDLQEAPAREEEVFVAERNPQAIKFTSNLVRNPPASLHVVALHCMQASGLEPHQ
jgi:hypothetical protein